MNVFLNAVWKIESFQALTKLRAPTNSPMLPTLVLESDSQTPITKRYAMNMPRCTTVGDSRTKARRRSFSRTAQRHLETGSAVGPARDRLAHLSVDLLQLGGRPLGRVGWSQALRGLGVHVGDDVLGVHLARLGVGRALPPDDPGSLSGRAVELHRFVEPAPQRIPLPVFRGSGREALHHFEPFGELVLRAEPPEQVFGGFLVLRVLHDHMGERDVIAPRSRRSGGNGEVIDVTPHRLPTLVLDPVLLALGRDVDRCAVERGGDLDGQERAVVVRIVPGEAPLVAGVLPERRHPLDRLDRFLAVELGLALAVALGGAEVPEHRIAPGRRVAEGVTERLADRVALLLESRPELPVFVERLRR